jgi:hypothetical protein
MKVGFLLAAPLTLIGLVGCVTQPPLVTECRRPMKGDRTVGPALVGHEYGPQTTPIPLDSVQFSSQATANSLAVQNLYAAHTPGNTTSVTARLISCADASFTVRVRTSFMDDNQAPTEPASAWQTVSLQPHLTATYAENSTSQNVANYLIEIMRE